jgi:hypothetical protein
MRPIFKRPAPTCSKDHSKMTTRDVSYQGYGTWRCLECRGWVREAALIRHPQPASVEVEEMFSGGARC